MKNKLRRLIYLSGGGRFLENNIKNPNWNKKEFDLLFEEICLKLEEER